MRASRPAAAARSAKRASGAATRRSRMPVRLKIQSSVTPSRSAIAPLPTTVFGRLVPTDAMPAVAVGLTGSSRKGAWRGRAQARAASRSSALTASTSASVRGTSFVRTRPGPLSTNRRAPSSWSASSVSRQRTGRVRPSSSRLRMSSNGRAGQAGEHDLARRSQVHLGQRRAEGRLGERHRGRVEGPADGEAHRAQALLTGFARREVQLRAAAREHDLGRRIVVGDGEAMAPGDLGGRALGLPEHREHAAVAICAGGLVHEPPAQHHQAEGVGLAQAVRGHQCRELAERVARRRAPPRDARGAPTRPGSRRTPPAGCSACRRRARSKGSSPTSACARSIRSGRWRSTVSRMSRVWLPWPGKSRAVVWSVTGARFPTSEPAPLDRPSLPPAGGKFPPLGGMAGRLRTLE